MSDASHESSRPPASEGDARSPASPPSTAPRRGLGLGAVVAIALVSAALSSTATVMLTRASATHEAAGQPHADGIMYQCPMHPSIIQDHPGDCPICGMKLVPVPSAPPRAAPSDAAATQAPPVAGLSTVDIDPARQQLIGLKTAEVTRGTVSGTWRTVGRVAVDETRVRHVNVKVPAFVEHVYVDYVGKKVRKGEPLFSVYSPELLAAQEEYLLALRTQGELAKAGAGGGKDDGRLVAAARRKLELWDIPPAELDKVVASGQPTKTLMFYSPASGVVTKKDVVEGMKLDAGAMPYEIVDLSSVWVLADVYESELRFVKEGMAANLTLAAFPNREFSGKVVFLDPLLDPASRTVKVRLTFANPAGELRPDMFGEVVLMGAPHEGLRIPTDAVIDSGTEKIVFLAAGEGKFQPRIVKLGVGDGANVEVLSGLAQGEQVVVRANFLVDSESRLRASLTEMTGSAASKAPESARVLPAPSAPEPASPPPAAGDHRGHGR